MQTIIIIWLLSALLGGFSAFDKKKSNETNERKADYVFMEATRQHALGNDDAYYDLLRRAHEINPTDDAIGYYVGYYNVMLAKGDSTSFVDGYRLMQQHFDKAPEDYYSSYTYGAISDHVGNVEESLRVWMTLGTLFPDKTEVALRLADALTQSGDSTNVRRTINVYDGLEKKLGKSIPLSSRKIRSYLALQDTAAVIDEMQRLLASSPKNSDNNVFAGDVYSLFNQNDSALVYYNRACDLDSTSGEAYFSRANFYKLTGDSVAYDREVFHALKMETLDLDNKIEIMTGYVRSLFSDPAQQPRIRELFASLIEQHPHEVSVRDLYYAYLVAVEDFEAATEQVGYVLDIDPSDARKWEALVSLSFQTEKHDRGVADATRALTYHPRNSSLLNLRARHYQLLQEYDKSLADIDSALAAIDPKELSVISDLHAGKGDILVSADRRPEAEAEYKLAVDYNPSNTMALNNYAYYLAVEERDLDRAAQMSARTIQERPDDHTLLDTYAWVLFKQKKFTEALVFIQKALDLTDEPNADIIEHAGDILFYTGDTQKAVEKWEEALKLNPENDLLKRKVQHRTYFAE